MQHPQSQRIEYLDSLRGIAALSVFYSHYVASFGAPSYLPFWLSKTPLSLIRDGFAGVSLFFVLSGMVLTYKYFKKNPADYDLKKNIAPFLINRFTRICLPFFALLVFSAITAHFLRSMAPPPLATSWLNNSWNEALSGWQVLRQAFLPLAAPTPHLLPQDWTLTIEFNVSMMMPFFTLIAAKSPLWFVFFILLQLKNHWYFAHFALGTLISKYFTPIRTWLQRKNTLFQVLFFALGLGLYTFRFTGPAYLTDSLFQRIPDDGIWIVTGFGSALLIISALGSHRLQKFLEGRFLVYLGKISYSIYLIHFLLLKTFCSYLFTLLTREGMTDINFQHLIVIPSATLFLILVSGLSYRLIEVPSIRLGRRLVKAKL